MELLVFKTFLVGYVMRVSIACCTSWYAGTCYGMIAHIACSTSSFCQLGSQLPSGRCKDGMENVGMGKYSILSQICQLANWKNFCKVKLEIGGSERFGAEARSPNSMVS